MALIQVLVGGTRLLFALPAYGLLAVAALGSLADLRRSKLPPSILCLATSALFFGWILVRACFSPVAYLAWTDAFMVLGALMVYLLTACYLTDPRRRLWVLSALVILALCNVAVGARQFAGDDKTTVFGFLRSAQYANRASGFYICPDHLSGFLEMVICLCIAMMVWSRTRAWVKILFGYVVLCCLAGLLMTGSRGGFLSVAFGLCVFTGLSLWRTWVTAPERFGRAVFVVIVAVVLLAAGAGVALSHSRTLGQRASHLVDTQDIRFQLWPSALTQFQQSPAFGTGSGTFLYYGRRFRNPGMQREPVRVHNDYLHLLAEYGAVGATGLLLFLAAHLWWGFRTFYQMGRRSAGQGAGEGSTAAAWTVGSLSAAACLMAHSAVDFNLHIPANALVLAFVFGVLANPGRSLESNSEQTARFRGVDLLPRLVLPALAVAVVLGGIFRLPGEYYAEQARTALRDNHNAAALDFARRGLEYEHDNPQLYDYLGRARMNLGGDGPDTLIARSFREAAVEAFSEAVRLSPQDSNLQARLGEAYARINAFDEAEKTFRQALFWDPNSSWVSTYYGFYLQQAGRYPEAVSAYQHAMSLDGNSIAFRNLGQIPTWVAAPILPPALPRSNTDLERN